MLDAMPVLNDKYRAIHRVLLITLVLNVIVAVAKLVVGYATDTLSMVADGYHSLLDASSNVVGFVAIYYASKPADDDHQYGHHKYETLSAMAISMALFMAAYRILAEAYHRVLEPVYPDVGWMNFVVMLVTIGVNFGVSSYERREGERLSSPLLLSDAAHTRSDVYASGAVILSLIAARAGLHWVDVLGSIAIAAIIVHIGYRIVRDGLMVIADGIVVEPELVQAIVMKLDGVAGCDNVRTRGPEDHVFMDLVCFVDGDMTMRSAHELADRIESAIQRDLPQVRDIVVHLAPLEARADHLS